MAADNGKPGGPGEADEAEVSRLRQMLLAQAAQGLAQSHIELNPTLNPQEVLQACAEALQMHEMGHFQPVIDDARPASPNFTDAPTWSMTLLNAKGRPVATVSTRKDLRAVSRTPEEFVGYLMIFGALTNPNIYALAAAHGYQLRFAQHPVKSKLIV